MTDEQLVKQLETALNSLKEGNEDAGEHVSGAFKQLDIDLRNITHSTGVAIGENIKQEITQLGFSPQLETLAVQALTLWLEQMSPPKSPDLPPLPAKIEAVAPGSANYIFISYARPNQAIAEPVEAYLSKAGFRIFRDTSVLRSGANWDMTIEQALRECDRMVLLLSRHSMPYRKEVYREWRFFDDKGKPLHPLYLESCDLHSRISHYQWLDARADLNASLRQLAIDLT